MLALSQRPVCLELTYAQVHELDALSAQQSPRFLGRDAPGTVGLHVCLVLCHLGIETFCGYLFETSGIYPNWVPDQETWTIDHIRDGPRYIVNVCLIH